MHYLLGTKVSTACALVLFSFGVCEAQQAVQDYANRMAQLRGGKELMVRGMNKPNYDEKFLHYGFYLGMNQNTFRIRRSPFFKNQLSDSTLWDTTAGMPLYGVNPKSSTGLTVGFILNMGTNYYPWMAYFDLRILPNVTFYQRSIEYRFRNDSVVGQLNQSTYSYIELPILLKYKSKRRNNTRLYMIGGIKPSFEVGGRRDELTRDFLRISTADLALDYGFGVELFYPYFNFSPEIRFSHGIQNMWTGDPNVYSRSINRVFSQSVSLILNFEG